MVAVNDLPGAGNLKSKPCNGMPHMQRKRLKLLKSEKDVEKFGVVNEYRRQVFRYF